MKSDSVEELFAEIIQHAPADRERHLNESTYPSKVKSEVLRLVKAFDSKSPLLNDDLFTDIEKVAPDFFDAAANQSDIQLKKGDRINGYRIRSVLGIGGMSVIYKAVQSQPVKRTVALKFIRPSIRAPKTISRFFREQQALALATHANIATLYNVETTDDGQPYAAMEYVNGLPITSFCDKFELTSRQRLILFLQACSALAHAHKHRIIHRDIKPDNILVCVRDKKPIVKLSDFGSAKLDQAEFQDNQTMTRFGQVLGSPRYMSPEQLAGKKIDQRSDTYSVALVLFELLSRSPYRKGEQTEEILREANQEYPHLLSKAIRQETKSGSSAFTDEAEKRFARRTQNDLDWVLSKALSREADDRYPALLDFAKDLRAIVRNKPVSVCRPNMFTRTKRFAFSYRRWLVAGLVFGLSSALLLTCALVYYNWQSSAKTLSQFRQANSKSEQQTADANDLVMRLLASDMYELKTDQFDVNLIPAYQTQFERIESNGGPQTEEDRTIFGILAVLHAMRGDFDKAFGLMERVGSDQAKSELRSVRDKICSEYAESAKLRLQKLAGSRDSAERAKQQMTLGRCYLVWDMLPDAETLLKDAIPVFDNQPECYEAIAARITLINIYDRANKTDEHKELLIKTYTKFKAMDKSDHRCQSAFDKVCRMLAKADPKNHGKLSK